MAFHSDDESHLHSIISLVFFPLFLMALKAYGANEEMSNNKYLSGIFLFSVQENVFLDPFSYYYLADSYLKVPWQLHVGIQSLPRAYTFVSNFLRV